MDKKRLLQDIAIIKIGLENNITDIKLSNFYLSVVNDIVNNIMEGK